MAKIIYDFGANNGDDIPYYLMKADLVVAVEANPSLCTQIQQRFRKEIDEGRIIVENCVLATDNNAGNVDFFIHKSNHVLSQFPPPEIKVASAFEKILLPSRTPYDIVETYGAPYYIKTDVEHYDLQILKSLFEHGIKPPYISAESHSLDVFLAMACYGGYNAFKLVDGHSVSDIYARVRIQRHIEKDMVEYSFPFHSAGPFGDDILGQWMTADNFFRLLAFEGLGWKDVHATNFELASACKVFSAHDHLNQSTNKFTGRELLSISLTFFCAACARIVKRIFRRKR